MTRFLINSTLTRLGRDYIVSDRFQSKADNRITMIELTPVPGNMAEYEAWIKAGRRTVQERLSVLEQERLQGFVYNVAPARL